MNRLLKSASRFISVRLFTSLRIRASNESRIMILAKKTRLFLNAATSDLFMFICNFCEIFLLLFILAYVLFQSVWILFLIFAGILGILYNLQDVFVYHPNEPPESKFFIEQPSQYNMPFETVELVTTDAVHLHSYLLKQTDENKYAQAPTVIMFHGNAGNIGQRLSLAQYFYTYCECNIFLVEYRGYGLSEGVQSEKGFYLDGDAAIVHLLSRTDIDTSKIILHGQSIGGAVVIDLAARFNEKLMAMIVENTFTSLPDIGRELFSGIPGVVHLPDFCFKNQFQSIEKVKYLTLPCLFISGQADTMIPPRMMKTLFDKCNSSFKRLLKLEDGNHNNTWLCAGYFQFINKFIGEMMAFRGRNQTSQGVTTAAPALVWHVNSN